MAEIYMIKPLEVKAIQFTDKASGEEIVNFVQNELKVGARIQFDDLGVAVLLQVFSFNGIIGLYLDDWLVVENEDNVKRVSPEAFALTYTKKDII